MGRKRIVVLASGEGTNFQALIDAIDMGRLNAEITGLISDRKSSGALGRARSNGITGVCLPRTEDNRERYFEEIDQALQKMKPDLIVTAGFMKIMPSWLVNKYLYRIINTHPSLLPCFGGTGFYGHRVHEKVLESGARITGCTVHFVTPDVDAGPIILQATVEVKDNDTPETLSERVKSAEHDLLIRATEIVLNDDIEISGKRVRRRT